MNQKNQLWYEFGNSEQRLEKAISDLKKGKGIIILDDEKRENEGDLVFACKTMTVEQMALTIRYGSGIVCLCITEKHRQKLQLPMMVENNTSAYKTPFTISIEAAKGVSTGVSAQDRLRTIKVATSKNVKPNDLNKPGHIFPLCANEGGLSVRKGHTEATIEIVKLAGYEPYGVLCELTNKDGSMARTNDTIKFAKKRNMQVLTIKDLIDNLKIG